MGKILLLSHGIGEALKRLELRYGIVDKIYFYCEDSSHAEEYNLRGKGLLRSGEQGAGEAGALFVIKGLLLFYFFLQKFRFFH